MAVNSKLSHRDVFKPSFVSHSLDATDHVIPSHLTWCTFVDSSHEFFYSLSWMLTERLTHFHLEHTYTLSNRMLFVKISKRHYLIKNFPSNILMILLCYEESTIYVRTKVHLRCGWVYV